jgi:hypothetical protein
VFRILIHFGFGAGDHIAAAAGWSKATTAVKRCVSQVLGKGGVQLQILQLGRCRRRFTDVGRPVAA